MKLKNTLKRILKDVDREWEDYQAYEAICGECPSESPFETIEKRLNEISLETILSKTGRRRSRRTYSRRDLEQVLKEIYREIDGVIWL